MDDDGCIVLENFLRKKASQIGGKSEDMKKQIYDMRVISSEDPVYLINSSAILYNYIILYR